MFTVFIYILISPLDLMNISCQWGILPEIIWKFKYPIIDLPPPHAHWDLTFTWI